MCHPPTFGLQVIVAIDTSRNRVEAHPDFAPGTADLTIPRPRYAPDEPVRIGRCVALPVNFAPGCFGPNRLLAGATGCAKHVLS